MGFADSHRPKKYDVCFLRDELQAKEVLDLETIYLFGMIPLKLFEGLDDRNVGVFNSALNAALALLVVFAFNEMAEIFQMIPMLGGSLRGHLWMLIMDELEFEVFQMVLEEAGFVFHEGLFCLFS